MAQENNPGVDLGIEHKFPKIEEGKGSVPEGEVSRGEIPAKEETQGRIEIQKEKPEMERKEILGSLDFTLAWLTESIKKAQTEEEKNRLQWILDSAQNSLKESREAYDGKYEVKSGENVQREGAPVDDLLEWLGVEISALTQEGKAEVVEKLERARQILEQNKQSYWRAHFGKELNEIEWNKDLEEKQHWRTKYEAELISQDWRVTGNQDSDYQKAEDAMAKREELVLPALGKEKEEAQTVPQAPEEVPVQIPKEDRPPEEVPLRPREEGPQKEKLVFANISAMIESAAWDAASAKMTEEKEKLGGVKGFFNKIKNIGKRVWKYNWFYEAYKRKEYEKARERIYRDYKEGRIDIDKLNIYAAEDETSRQEKHHEAMGAIFERFGSEYDEAVEGEAGEEKKKIEDESIKREIRELIRDYAEGSISEGDLARKHNEILGKVAGPEADIKYEVDNLLEIAERIKRVDSHNKGREALELDLEIIRGRARGGIKTEAGLGRLDRIIDKMKKMRGLSWINETTLAVGATAVYCIGRAVSKRFAYSKAANIALFGGTAALSGAYAGILENKRVKEERAQHIRERAKGKTFAPEAKRRQEMEKFRYETAEARNILQELQNNFYDSYEIKGKRTLKDLSETELAQALGDLADLEARLSLSNAHKIDLISYSNLEEVEKERTRLLILRSQIKADLKDKYPAGFKIKGENQNLDDLVNISKAELMQGKDEAEGISKKDHEFNKMKAKRVAKRVAQAAVTGLILGATFQEIQAAMDDNTQSLLEGILQKNTDAGHQSALEGLRDWITPGKGEGAAGELSKIMIAGHEVQVGLPKGAELKDPDGDGIYSLFYHNKELCDKVSFDDKGNLTNEARAALASRGVRITETMPEGGVKEALAGVSTPEGRMTFVEKYSELFKKITHEMWYDNNTPKPIFDHNELRLDWGGEGGIGLNENGDYVYSIQRMTADGSWHKEFSVDAHEAAERGGLSLLLSASHDTEQYVIPIKIDQDFNAIIPKDSEAARMLFTQDAQGHAVFLGDHAEVSQMMGKTNTEGSEWIRVLATDSGKNAPVIPEPVEPVPIPIFEIPPQTDLPPVIPILGRKPLERMRGGELLPPPYYYYGGFVSPELKKIFAERRSETLQNNPEAILDHHKEAEKYINAFSREYRQELDQLVGQAGKMSKENRLSICIPVAGHQEGKNIYESLKNYTYQNADPKQYEIVLFVNHPDQDPQGNKIAPDETLDEIKKFQQDFPEMNVRVMYSVLPREKAKIGLIRKMLNDATLLRHHQRGKEAPDLIMASNDADNRGVAPEYVENLLKKFEKNSKLDGMVGQLDWDPESYTKYPAVHIGTRVFQYLGVLDRHHGAPVVSSGANFAFRSSIYAGIGGYTHELGGGEDTALGQAISEARKSEKTLGYAGARVSRLFTSSRRAVKVLREGLAPVEQWDSNFSAFENEVRKLELGKGEEIDYDNPEAVKKLKQQLEYIINRTFNYYKRYGGERPKDLPDYKKTLGWLGIKYKLDEKGDVVITDMSRLVKDLKTYKEEGILIRDAKSGKKEVAKQLKGARIKRKELSIKEQQDFERKVEQEMPKFYSTDHLDLEITERAVDTDVETISQDQEMVGVYVVAKDLKLYDQKTSKVFRAVKQGEKGRPLVAKEVGSQKMIEEARLRGVPEGFQNIEQYLESKKFHHPNVGMPIESIIKDDRTIRFYEASDIDLEKYLADYKRMPVKQALSLMIRVCDGIRAVHKEGVAYVDCAPLNIVLTKDSAKIIDLDEASIDMNGEGEFKREIIGVNRFALAPEMFSKKPRFDKTVDVYSACATLYRMITGEWPYNLEKETADLPYEERMLRYRKAHQTGDIKFPDTMSDRLQIIIKKGMSPSPSARYQSINELLVDLLDARESLKNQRQPF